MAPNKNAEQSASTTASTTAAKLPAVFPQPRGTGRMPVVAAHALGHDRRVMLHHRVGTTALTGVAVLALSLVAAAASPAASGKVVRGTPRADTLRGGGGADVLSGLGGNDRLLGLGGRDV